MRKQKNLAMLALVCAIIGAVYNFLVFIIFGERSAVFWISYSFTMLAFCIQVGSMFMAFKNTSVETIFFGMPLASFSIFYLVSQVVVSFIFMIFQQVGTTIPLVIFVLMLATFLVIAIIAIMARETVQAIDSNIKQKIVTHKALNVDVDMLLAGCSNPELKSKLRKLSETIKYSDPMTNDAVKDVEERIEQKVSELRILCENDQIDDAIKACSSLELLFVERNKKLIISK
jgi:hypothetical protein